MAARLGRDASEAASRLLACALEDARDWPGPVVLAPADETDAAWLAINGLGACDIVLQHGQTLGERINAVDAVLRSRGLERLIYIGTDCPSLDTSYLSDAAAALDRADAVLGPATDGGVVLMGARHAWPPIGDLAWSTPALLDGLLTRLNDHRWRVVSLATLADVDSVEDLTAVGARLSNDARPARRALVDWLGSLDRSHTETS
jgi:glycosyltransferase A (GT-A) superfamily protein (DUF2064 family)